MAGWVLGVIGGSGLYGVEGLTNARWTRIDSPFGAPSDELLVGELGHVRLVFLPRHGRGHRLPPSAINARANIDALKRAGCTDILSISAAGSLREALAPGAFVVVDQFIDRTFARERSFFGPGLVAHVSMGDPVCRRLSHLAAAAAGGRRASRRGRNLPGHGGTPVLHPRRERALPVVGLRRDRHDRHAGGQARPRGGAALCVAGDDHRLRLLARQRRRGERDPGGAGRQC